MGKIAYCARKLSLRPRRQNVFACALIPRTADTKPTWEFPRLCRGGSKSLTYPAVDAARSIAATRRGAKHTKGVVSMDGLKPDARTVVQLCERCRPSKEDVEAFLGGGGAAELKRHGKAASSGSKTKAPGSAGGYLLSPAIRLAA